MWHMNLDQMFTAAFTDTNTSSLVCVTVPIYPMFAMSSSIGGTALDPFRTLSSKGVGTFASVTYVRVQLKVGILQISSRRGCHSNLLAVRCLYEELNKVEWDQNTLNPHLPTSPVHWPLSRMPDARWYDDECRSPRRTVPDSRRIGQTLATMGCDSDFTVETERRGGLRSSDVDARRNLATTTLRDEQLQTDRQARQDRTIAVHSGVFWTRFTVTLRSRASDTSRTSACEHYTYATLTHTAVLYRSEQEVRSVKCPPLGHVRGSPTRDEESSACPCLSVSACYIRKHLFNGLNYPVAVPITRLYYRFHHRPRESWPGYDCRNESRPHLRRHCGLQMIPHPETPVLGR
ncbi:hypothetical protein HETIRDRAFT_428238 [Heterobasidion irregulare TC 32-1]|uniref:Uncharacterized protein n=1 Tax=Heterobasidion irregulare (strain TC 32-1) TaxID=747525 RepID=W4K3C9_HETIT|nr:uncharacterized protein HETIRDRAFT_428238 [Heterobasidion irregulare TC 32-1]ETW79835.1 hypothetical protein HETIRDRAFT_428238 [Heterobasidion irregulare TC 32-1]